jgi:hypothetical protein
MYVGWAIYKILDAMKIAIIIPVFKKIIGMTMLNLVYKFMKLW